MRLSTRGRYGVRAMLDLAVHATDGPVSLRDMAKRQELSLDYLEQLLRKLRQARLVRSVRGPRGGFVLARPPARITLWQVVCSLEEGVAPVFCVDECVMDTPTKRRCARSKKCASHLLWAGLARQMRLFLESNSLQDLANSALRISDDRTPLPDETFDI